MQVDIDEMIVGLFPRCMLKKGTLPWLSSDRGIGASTIGGMINQGDYERSFCRVLPL